MVFICIHLQVHLLTENIVKFGMLLLKFGLPIKFVDIITSTLGRLRYGNVSKYGLQTPKEGPFFNKLTTGRSPTIDVGTVDKIKSGHVKVRTTHKLNCINLINKK